MKEHKKAVTPEESLRSLQALAVMGGEPRRKPVQHEAGIQESLFEWAELNESRHPELKLLHAIPNGGKRDAITGYHLKRQGVKSGVPDICLPVARRNSHALYIELKAEGGRVQESQKVWIAELNKQKYRAVVCYGLDEAIKTLEWYLNLNC